MALRSGSLLATGLSALLLAGCSTPTSRLPAVDRDRAQAEAQVQAELARGAAASSRHHGRPGPGVDPDDRDIAEQARLLAVGWRLLSANTALCGNHVQPQIGALFTVAAELPEPLRIGYAGRFPAEDDAVVQAVAAGSPAATAGILPGDMLVTVDGRPAPQGAKAAQTLHGLFGAATGALRLGLRRSGGGLLEKPVIPVRVCASQLRYERLAVVNAFADGRAVIVTAGMMRAVSDDDQLATAIGHELAHNVMGHLAKKAENAKKTARIGSVLTVITGAPLEDHWAGVGNRAFSQDFEAEADYVGLYFAAAAGFDVAKGPSFWRRMAVVNPLTIDHANTHPTTPDRFVALEETAREIAAKRAAGLPLRPEAK
jgi:hypothetical protein